MLGKFLRLWREREKAADMYLKSGPISSVEEMRDPAGVALALSKRLIAVVKMKNIVNIEAGLEMIALAMSISSEVFGFHVGLKTLIDFLFRMGEYFQRWQSTLEVS